MLCRVSRSLAPTRQGRGIDNSHIVHHHYLPFFFGAMSFARSDNVCIFWNPNAAENRFVRLQESRFWSGGRIQSRKLVFGFFAHHLAILCVALNLFRYFIRRINLPRLQSAYLYSWISNDQFLVSVLSFYIIERGHSGWHNGCLLRYVVNSATCSHADPYHGHWIPASPVQQVFIRWNTVGESFVSILGKSQCGRLKL